MIMVNDDDNSCGVCNLQLKYTSFQLFNSDGLVDKEQVDLLMGTGC